MNRNNLIYGLITGTLLSINLIFTLSLFYSNPDFKGNEVFGYGIMVAIYSFVFLGIRNYRNNQLNGFISFGNAMKRGTIIALIGSTIYVVFWLFYYYLVVPDFLEKYISFVLRETAKSGSSVIEIAEKTKEMNSFRELYQNPLFIIVTTYAEVLPVGLLVALVSSAILKRKSTNENLNIEAN